MTLLSEVYVKRITVHVFQNRSLKAIRSIFYIPARKATRPQP